MAKSELRIRARELRKEGRSIRDIAQRLDVSRSSASRWCSDIKLSDKQIAALLRSKQEGIRRGQLVAAELKKNKRLQKIAQYQENGIQRFRSLADSQFFAAGLALYLGEGSKKERKVAFVNSDPDVILFMLAWLRKFFHVPVEHIAPRIHIHEMHRKRLRDILRYWAELLGISESQFRATIFTRTKQLKLYENYENYYGTLTIRVLKSAELFYKIDGLIYGLLKAAHLPTYASASSVAFAKNVNLVSIFLLTCRRSSAVRAKHS